MFGSYDTYSIRGTKSLVLWGKKALYQSVFDLFPLTNMCVDIDFRSISDRKAERFSLRHEKRFLVVVVTFFIELFYRCSLLSDWHIYQPDL